VTTIDLERAERAARAGAPYPYSSPTEAREAHQRAAGQALSRYLLWGYLVGAPGFLALFVPLAWHSGTALLILGGGVAALAVAALAMVPLWKTIGRHRAVLEAYGIATNVYGQVLPPRDEAAEWRVQERLARAAEGKDLRAEARRAVRIYLLVVGLNVAMVAAFWVVAALVNKPIRQFQSVLPWALPCVAAGLVLGYALHSALARVEAASAGKYTRGSRSAGVVAFIAALTAGVPFASLTRDVIVPDGVLPNGDEWVGLLSFGMPQMLIVAFWALVVARSFIRKLREMSEGVTPPIT
jgi:hypothetical protein